MEGSEPPRTWAQRALIAAYAVALGLLAAMLVVGVPVLTFVRAGGAGSTAAAAAWALLGVAWSCLVITALVRDRETRGWILFLLVGWATALPGLLRRGPR